MNNIFQFVLYILIKPSMHSVTFTFNIQLQILPSDHKVKEWLEKQDESSTPSNQDGVLKLLETWPLDHVQIDKNEISLNNRFAISESGAIVISCEEQPHLSLIYPGTKKPPLILTTESHRFATFIKSADREFLVTLGSDDENLHLWDISKGTSTKKFDPKMHEGKFKGYPKIFVIDDKTMGYAAEPSNKRFRVFFINMGEDRLETWSGSILIPTNMSGSRRDICFIKMRDGTPCLLLCSNHDRCVQAVQMIGGKIRWETGVQQMGKHCQLWSIYTDEINTVYVTDSFWGIIHILSGEDGTFIRSINLGPYGIYNPLCVRVHDKYLYMMHGVYNKRYEIAKFSIELAKVENIIEMTEIRVLTKM